jgi:sporulation protein YlmC with PRC-barrel domain
VKRRRRVRRETRPATSETEGTAADHTAPGATPTTGGEAAKAAAQRSELIGAEVVSSANARLGEVVDVVFDARKQPAFVVIESEGRAAAVPYGAAASMKKADKIVIEQSRLKGAPKLEEGAWRDPANERWKQESTRYWERG